MYNTVTAPGFVRTEAFQHYPASTFPEIHPVHWLHSHFAVGGWSPLQRLSGMITAHMTEIAPDSGFTWHPHRGLEIYTWVLEGTIHHEDSTGGAGDIGAGELQRMFSGDWIEHQELNLSDDPVRVIQIWFAADPNIADSRRTTSSLGAISFRCGVWAALTCIRSSARNRPSSSIWMGGSKRSSCRPAKRRDWRCRRRAKTCFST
jgi:hypothetical protein